MKVEKFRSIKKYNIEHRSETSKYIRAFYSELGLETDSDVLNLFQIARSALKEKNYLLLELPFKDKEIGAICYKGVSQGYVFLNSSLPKVNVNFALCHEVYHVFFQKRPMKHAIELYINEHYFEDEEEYAANAFAGELMMPEMNFRRMYNKFRNEMEDGENELVVIVKLMNYFEASFMGVLIRSCELELINDSDLLESLFKIKSENIKTEFARLWLDESILEPSNRDDFVRFESLVRKEGDRMQTEEILSEETVKKALSNMKRIYKQIREG